MAIVILCSAGQGEIESKPRILAGGASVSSRMGPREDDKNRNQVEHDNLGLGIIQWYSANLK